MLIAGRIVDEQLLLDAGFSRVACINPPGLHLDIAMQPETAKENIRSLRDHIILADEQYYSFAENKKL